jgi:hypothetical protein
MALNNGPTQKYGVSSLRQIWRVADLLRGTKSPARQKESKIYSGNL